ncbi:hypothetical protein Poli38472_004495 [Pythium oligandrum]|uniref:Complex 1 LYR protein domain-containing protein n=1 Tax=Pythium oligandrum TaxID=41045 RepID=A0A8K1CAK0_PYTOL|nr:hypothetical protein Poli38472_004495 [Pythium oligandrum]|eukprot:TMW59426.1 hypothetical protein Poli38472_004495 [Pythium oligandrum]
MLVDKRKEVLRLYREILRTTRHFQWTNEQGEQWGAVLRKNARMEFEQHRHETSSENISRMLIIGWKCVEDVQAKMASKATELSQNQPK